MILPGCEGIVFVAAAERTAEKNRLQRIQQGISSMHLNTHLTSKCYTLFFLAFVHTVCVTLCFDQVIFSLLGGRLCLD